MIPTLDGIRYYLKTLGYSEERISDILLQIEHFESEAPRRDDIIKEYFDNECIQRIILEIIKEIIGVNKKHVKLLDIGAGSGFFTTRIIKMLSQLGITANAYGLDVTPGMLRILETKGIRPIWGTSEKILESIKLARTHVGENIPEKFDIITTMFNLHHLQNPSDAFESIAKIIDKKGIVIVVDIYRYDDPDLQKMMKDVHPGFTTRELNIYAKPYFKETNFRLMQKVKCKAENVETGVIIGVLKNPIF